jgi:hypothetical protein
MNFRPRHFLIRWVLPLTWKFDERQRTRVLQEFAQTELDSAWQSVFALSRVDDPKLRALLFHHAYEELFHSDLFHRMAHRKAGSIPVLPLTRREPLLPLERGNVRAPVEFFAFLAIGESEIQRDFGVYERSIPDEEVRRLFAAIRSDEEYHAEDAGRALGELTAAAGISLGWVRVRHLASLAYKRYISLATKFGTIPMTALLFLAYSLFGALFARQARERLALPAGRQLDFLTPQQRALDSTLGGRP